MKTTAKSKMGRPKGPTLTETDHAVIHKIAAEGFQTYDELRAGPLKDDHRVHAWKRMRRLVRANLIRECRADNGGVLGWAIHSNGISKLYGNSAGGFEKAGKAPLYRTSFAHDLLLRKIKGILEKSHAVVAWIPEHDLRAQVMREFHYLHPHDRREKLLTVPDAILHVHSGGADSKAVLELELTQKARHRLYSKIESYVISRDFDYAFFIAKDEKLLACLKDVHQEVLSKSVRVKIAKERNGIYFATVGALQEKGLHAKFSGPHDQLTFAELSE